jgi:glycosyltransferase involved in cell wall biosynthesis
MLDAFLLLAGDESLPPLSLHVFGRGDPEIELRLEASPGVTFHGSSAYDEIVGFLASHDCIGLVLLDATPRYSLVSTNCHKLYEYLAAGAPVLATDVGEIPDIVATLDGGWVIEAGFGVEGLAGALRNIVTQPSELRRRGDAAAAAVEHHALWWEGEWRKVESLGVLDRQ